MSAVRRPIVTLTTDFGSVDEYVGVMKGQVLRRCSDAVIVDVTHGIEPGDVLRGALLIADAVPHFPDGTVHVAVVDPGVGSDRRALLIDCETFILVGPDNGLLSLAMPAGAQAYALDKPEFFSAQVSRTFHGRDVFAPVAGHLAAGGTAAEMGSPVADIKVVRPPSPVVVAEGLRGEILYSDRFGNLVTTIDAAHLNEVGVGAVVVVEDLEIGPISATYADAPEDTLVAVVGSTGRLEIAVVRGSAEQRLGQLAGRGTRVDIRHKAP